MSVYKRPGSEFYSYDFRHRRQRFSGSTGCKTKREAIEFEKRERKRVTALQIDAGKPLTFHAAAARYWNEVGTFHRNHVDTLRSLDWLQQQIGKSTLVSTISDSVVASVVAKRRGDGVSPATVNRTVTELLRGLMRRAGEVWGQEVPKIAWRKHMLKEAQERIREASAEEEAKLFAAIRGDYAPALRFALMTGCRLAEIVGLRWPAVDFFTRNITIHGKGDRKRVIPMTQALYDLLRAEHGNHAEMVFTYVAKMPRKDRGKRKPITYEGLKTEWRRTKKRAGVDDYRFHDNRHTAATRLVRATGNLRYAQRLLGHTDLATTMRYAHVTNDDLRAGLEAASATESPTAAGAGRSKRRNGKKKKA